MDFGSWLSSTASYWKCDHPSLSSCVRAVSRRLHIAPRLQKSQSKPHSTLRCLPSSSFLLLSQLRKAFSRPYGDTLESFGSSLSKPFPLHHPRILLGRASNLSFNPTKPPSKISRPRARTSKCQPKFWKPFFLFFFMGPARDPSRGIAALD